MWELILTGLGLLWNAIESAAIAIWEAIVTVWRICRPIFDPIINAAEKLWDNVLGPFWRTIEGWLAAARKWFDTWLGPVKDIIKSIYKAEQYLYDAFFKPLLDTISRIRQLITLLGLQNTALGKAFEDFLGRLYVDINNIYQQITQPVNRIIETIETIILDTQNLLRVDLLLNSIFRSIRQIWNEWWNSGIKLTTPDGKSKLYYWSRTRKVRQAHDDLKQYLDTGAGDLEPYITEALATFATTLQLEDPNIQPPDELTA